MRIRSGPPVALLLMTTLSLAAAQLDAVVFNVTKLTDSNDGVCDSDCSLREAIRAANVTVGADTVVLPAGTLELTIAGRGENAAATGDLDVVDDLEIRGQGAEVTIIDGNQIDRVLHIFSASVEIVDLTVCCGRAEGDDHGGGIASDGNSTLRDLVVRDNTVVGDEGAGGGITNTSVMRVERTTVSGNTVSGSSGNGGGIENTSELEVESSTLSGNSTIGLFGNGGGLINTAEATLRNSTISGNSASGNFGDGGGIHTSSELTLLNVTIHGNSAGDDGDAIAGTGIHQTFTNSLISGDCDASSATVTQGGNLESPGNTCGFGGGDQTGISAPALALGPLANNGGPTRTHALQAGSAAIDRALNGPCPAEDQRLRNRPEDGDGNGSAVCDVGAFERAGDVGDPVIFTDGFESGDTSAWNP